MECQEQLTLSGVENSPSEGHPSSMLVAHPKYHMLFLFGTYATMRSEQRAEPRSKD